MKDTGLNTAAGEVIVRQLKSIHRELYTRDQELTARLELIVEATRRLTACAERSELSRRLLETFANNLAADGGSLFLCHQDHLELVHSLDPYHAPASLPLPLPENSIFGQVLRTRIPLLIRDLERERTLQPSGWEWYKDGSLLVLPLTDSGDKIVALVSLHNKRWPPFTRQDLELGRILGALSMEALHCLHTKEYYKELIENCSDLISVIEADRTIRYVSPSVQNILGYRPEELIDTKAFTFIHPDEVEEVRAAFENGKKNTGRAQHLSFRYRRRDGSWRTVEASAKNALHVGPVGGFIINARDVTEQRRAQEQVRRMMHKMLEGLEKGAKRIEQLIRGLKEYSHLENTQSGQGLDVRTVVETAVTITGSLIRNSTHRFPVQLPDTLPRVRGNNSQIEQMIVNLIANACQALSNPDQAITITARHDQGSDTVAIRIRNEGVGIAADHLHRITDPFYTTRRDSGGTGLGLSLCHRIAETNGGQLSFVSRVGTGTTVTGTLPLHKPDRPHNQLQQESQSRTD